MPPASGRSASSTPMPTATPGRSTPGASTTEALEGLLQELRDVGLRVGADEAAHRLTALEEDQGRDAAHAELRGVLLVAVGVDLVELDLAGVLAGELLDDRRNRFAGLAPGRPEIDEDRLVRLENLLLEGGI